MAQFSPNIMANYLAARAKLNLAEISALSKARVLSSDVLEMEGLDPYLIKKARVLNKNLQKNTG